MGASAGFKDAFIGGWPLLAFILILISVSEDHTMDESLPFLFFMSCSLIVDYV